MHLGADAVFACFTLSIFDNAKLASGPVDAFGADAVFACFTLSIFDNAKLASYSYQAVASELQPTHTGAEQTGQLDGTLDGELIASQLPRATTDRHPSRAT